MPRRVHLPRSLIPIAPEITSPASAGLESFSAPLSRVWSRQKLASA